MKQIHFAHMLRTSLNVTAFAVAVALGTPVFAGQPVAISNYGTPVKAGQPHREIRLDSATRWVNVQQNETIRFVVDGRSFMWRFDTLGTPTFELNQVAPAGMLSGGAIRVYVAPDPMYRHN